MDKNIVEKDNFKEFQIIIDKKKGFIKTLLALIVSTLILPLTLSFIYFISPNYIRWSAGFLVGLVMHGALSSGLAIPIYTYVKNNYPIFRLNFLINLEKIEVKIGNQIYFKEAWKNIKRIEAIDESYTKFQAKYMYKLIFFTQEDIKEFRLYMLFIIPKDRAKIINIIENISQKYNIKLNISNYKYDDNEKQDYFNSLDKERLLVRIFVKKDYFLTKNIQKSSKEIEKYGKWNARCFIFFLNLIGYTIFLVVYILIFILNWYHNDLIDLRKSFNFIGVFLFLISILISIKIIVTREKSGIIAST